MKGLKITDIMTEGVIGIDRTATVREAAKRMSTNNIRGLVVLDGKEVVGILAGKDVLYNVVSKDKRPSDVKVEDIMTSEVVTAFETDEIYDVAMKMIQEDISRVPIVNAKDEILGIVTQSNLVKTWPGYVDFLEEKASMNR